MEGVSLNQVGPDGARVIGGCVSQYLACAPGPRRGLTHAPDWPPKLHRRSVRSDFGAGADHRITGAPVRSPFVSPDHLDQFKGVRSMARNWSTTTAPSAPPPSSPATEFSGPPVAIAKPETRHARALLRARLGHSHSHRCEPPHQTPQRAPAATRPATMPIANLLPTPTSASRNPAITWLSNNASANNWLIPPIGPLGGPWAVVRPSLRLNWRRFLALPLGAVAGAGAALVMAVFYRAGQPLPEAVGLLVGGLGVAPELYRPASLDLPICG